MVMLRAQGVSVRFGGVQALRDVTFELGGPGIYALIGPNGAGKTTLFGVISGGVRATSGQLWFGDRQVLGWKPWEAARSGVARTFQITRAWRSLTVMEHVELAAVASGESRGAARARAAELCGSVGLSDVQHRLARELPLGQQRRMEIARALALGPSLLLLDEALAGLTATEAGELVQLISALPSRDICVLITEHVMELVMPIAHTVLVLDHGVLIAVGPPAEVARDPTVLAAYLGDAHVTP